jgi:hypothetical protein
LLNPAYPLLKTAPPTEHREMTLDTKIFDRYAGAYQMDPLVLMTVSRSGDRFYSQLTGQPKFEVFAESDRKFFLKVVDAQLTFETGEQGPATQVTLHQNGQDVVAKRLNEAETARVLGDIEAHNADVAKRFKAQSQSPGTEDAVRRSIREVQAGEPRYDLMTDQLARITRQQLPQLKTVIAGWGPVQSVKFQGCGPGRRGHL